MESPANRPTAVTILGSIFLVVAALYVPFTFWRWSPSSAWPPRSGAPWYDWFNAVWHPYVCVLWSIFVAVSAVQFLRLRAWARTALEVIAWLPLALAGGQLAVAVLLWLPSDPGLGLLSTIIVLVFGVVVGVPCVIIIRLLRSPGVRGAMIVGRQR